MNRLLVFVFILAITAILSAQEFTSQNYSTAIVNNRYEISYTIPANDREQNDYFDVFIFARLPGGEWTRLRALFGDYLHVQGYFSHKVRWEPVFDFMRLQKYEFRIYAVNRKFLPAAYSYQEVNEIGTLNLFSELDDVSYRISGQPASFRLDPALPAGDYEVEIYRGQKRMNLKTVTVGHMQLADVDLTPVEGYLTLSSNIAEAVFYVNGETYPAGTEINLPVGMHQVWASVTSPVTGTPDLPHRGVLVEKLKSYKQHFEFDYGYLTVTSNEAKAQFKINGKTLGKVQKLLLPVGRYNVEAFLPVSGASSFRPSNQQEMLVTKDETTKVSLNFGTGTLTLTSNLPGVTYLVDGVAFDKVEKVNCYAGTRNITAQPEQPSPYQPITKAVTISPGIHTPVEMKFVETEEIKIAKRRQKFAEWHNLGFLRTVALNHYFQIDTSNTNDPLAMHQPIGQGISFSLFNYTAMSLNFGKAANSYQAKYPQIYGGLGLFDEIILMNNDQTLMDIFSANLGIVNLSPKANSYSCLDTAVTISDTGWGVRSKFRVAWRIAEGNYLYLNLGARYNLQSLINSVVLEPCPETGANGQAWHSSIFNSQALKAAVSGERSTFYIGFGWDNNILTDWK